MTIIKVAPKAVAEAIYSLAEVIISGENCGYFDKRPDQRKEQGLKLDAIKEIAEHSTADFMELPHETLILFAEYLPKTQAIKPENDNT